MIETSRKDLSLSRQCHLLSINRSNLYYLSKGESPLNLTLMRLIDEQFLKTPYYGSRQMVRHLQRLGYCIGRKRVRRFMRLMGLKAVYQSPKTSTSNSEHKVYPYLLRNLNIIRSNQVWCTDITYISIKRGFMYLVAIMDWYSRKVLAWRLSNSLDVDFCCEALNEAIQKYGIPEIFNTDQGSQFTSFAFTNILKNHQIKISMDGKGSWMDNVFVERLWRSLKYECIYLHNFGTANEAKTGICAWVNHYNLTRPHSTFDGQTPDEVYVNNLEKYLSPEIKWAA